MLLLLGQRQGHVVRPHAGLGVIGRLSRGVRVLVPGLHLCGAAHPGVVVFPVGSVADGGLYRRSDEPIQGALGNMRNRITYVSGEDRESLLFGATWFYDLIRQVVIPAVVLFSLPLCVRLSLSIFDFDHLFVKFYENPFILLSDLNGVETLRVSARSIVYLLALFFVMQYISRAIHATWQYGRYFAFMRKHNRTSIRPNEINLSLGNSIISVMVWMLFAMVVISVWQIPTVWATGLNATVSAAR